MGMWKQWKSICCRCICQVIAFCLISFLFFFPVKAAEKSQDDINSDLYSQLSETRDNLNALDDTLQQYNTSIDELRKTQSDTSSSVSSQGQEIMTISQKLDVVIVSLNDVLNSMYISQQMAADNASTFSSAYTDVSNELSDQAAERKIDADKIHNNLQSLNNSIKDVRNDISGNSSSTISAMVNGQNTDNTGSAVLVVVIGIVSGVVLGSIFERHLFK